MVRYRPMQSGVTSWLVSPLRDLSSGGARFLSEQQFSVGDVMELQLVLPVSPQPIALKARVAWTKARPGTTLGELGVTFDPGDVAIQRTIDAAIAHFLKKPGG